MGYFWYLLTGVFFTGVDWYQYCLNLGENSCRELISIVIKVENTIASAHPCHRKYKGNTDEYQLTDVGTHFDDAHIDLDRLIFVLFWPRFKYAENLIMLKMEVWLKRTLNIRAKKLLSSREMAWFFRKWNTLSGEQTVENLSAIR